MLLHDPKFLDVHPCESASTAARKAANIFTKIKRAFQKAVERNLTQKATTGDLAPKPASNTLFMLAEETASLATKFAPAILRAVNSPATIAIGVTTCALILLLDDTTRNMAMDQISQVMAMFQNEAADNKSGNSKSPKIEL